MNRTHGHTCQGQFSRTYLTWQSMLGRCRSKTHTRYSGRGISVCERWHKFENFLADMGERPKGKTLDRYPDNDGNYEPGNCRWATPKEQAENTRRSRPLTIYGLTLPIQEWGKISGTKYSTIYMRLVSYGYSAKEAVFGRL